MLFFNIKRVIIIYKKNMCMTTILYLISMLIFYIVFKLNDISLKIYMIGFNSSFFIFIMYLFVSLFMYKKDENKNKIIDEITVENNRLIEEFSSFKNGIIEYFMMWVHQIKTPITASFLVVDSMDDSMEKKMLNSSLFSIDRYTNMVLDYLKLIEKDSNLDISEVYLDDVLTDIFKRYSFLFINNKIKLDYETIDKKVITDYKWISILLEQLISNAIKYTKEGRISVLFDEDVNALIIRDTGIGIRKEDIPRIFDRGFSGFNGRMNKQSSGIGLYIVKKISEKINVDIKLESKIGEGSTFYVIFNTPCE